jgi:A-macroglobulin receptor binding domain
MILAEVGLPPGVDVDRSSLDAAMHEHGYDINHYDILPDRIVLYLWPRAGGSEFSFTFRPRFKMEAATAPSLLYDY